MLRFAIKTVGILVALFLLLTSYAAFSIWSFSNENQLVKPMQQSCLGQRFGAMRPPLSLRNASTMRFGSINMITSTFSFLPVEKGMVISKVRLRWRDSMRSSKGLNQRLF